MFDLPIPASVVFYNWRPIRHFQVVYAACQMSADFCKSFAGDDRNMENLISILQGKVGTSVLCLQKVLVYARDIFIW